MLYFANVSVRSDAEAALSENDVFDVRIQKIVNAVIKSIVKRKGIPGYMADDFAVELFLELNRVADRFNPEKSDFVNYARMVVNRYAVTLIRKYRNESSHLETVSADTPVGSEGLTITDSIPAPESKTKTDADRVHEVLEMMPEDLRLCCYEIMKAKSIREVAKKYGMTHTGFIKKYLGPIRTLFIAHEKELQEKEDLL